MKYLNKLKVLRTQNIKISTLKNKNNHNVSGENLNTFLNPEFLIAKITIHWKILKNTVAYQI